MVKRGRHGNRILRVTLCVRTSSNQIPVVDHAVADRAVERRRRIEVMLPGERADSAAGRSVRWDENAVEAVRPNQRGGPCVGYRGAESVSGQ